MKPMLFDPDERAREKAASRERDQEMLVRGAVSRVEMQRVNGGSSATFRSAMLRPQRERRELSLE